MAVAEGPPPVEVDAVVVEEGQEVLALRGFLLQYLVPLLYEL